MRGWGPSLYLLGQTAQSPGLEPYSREETAYKYRYRDADVNTWCFTTPEKTNVEVSEIELSKKVNF